MLRENLEKGEGRRRFGDEGGKVRWDAELISHFSARNTCETHVVNGSFGRSINRQAWQRGKPGSGSRVDDHAGLVAFQELLYGELRAIDDCVDVQTNHGGPVGVCTVEKGFVEMGETGVVDHDLPEKRRSGWLKEPRRSRVFHSGRL